MRVVLDSCAADKLIEPPARLEAVMEAVTAGRLELLVPGITRRELLATEEGPKRTRFEQLLTFTVPIPDAAFVVGVSAVGTARMPDEALIDVLRRGNRKHSKDAAIAAAALIDGGGAVVTCDKRFRLDCGKVNIAVMSPEELLAAVGGPQSP